MLAPEVMAALTAKGYVGPTGRVRQRDIAKDLGEILKRDHVVTRPDTDEFNARSATVDELSVAAFGMSSSETRTLISGMTGPLGPTQRSLGNGYVLGTTRVTRVVSTASGQPVQRTFAARFLSEHPDVIREHVLDAQVERLGRSAGRVNELVDVVVQRRPELAGYRTTLALQAVERVRQQLPASTR